MGRRKSLCMKFDLNDEEHVSSRPAPSEIAHIVSWHLFKKDDLRPQGSNTRSFRESK